jgi:hypothetical protein
LWKISRIYKMWWRFKTQELKKIKYISRKVT